MIFSDNVSWHVKHHLVSNAITLLKTNGGCHVRLVFHITKVFSFIHETDNIF